MKKNGRVYRRMIITYILVLSIPILLSVVLYQYTHETMQDQSKEQNDDLLETIKNVCDREISYYGSVLQQLKGNEEIKRLVNSTTTDEALYRWLAIEASQEVANIKNAMLDYSEFCRDIFVYLFDQDIMLSDFGGKTSLGRYGNFWMEMTAEEEAWFTEQLNSVDQRKMVAVKIKEKDYILLLERMTSKTGKKQNAVVGLWIDPTSFEMQIRSTEWKGKREWAFISNDGHRLHVTENLKVESFDLGDQKGDQIKIGGDLYEIHSLRSTTYDGKYFLLSSVKGTSQAASRVRNVHLICMAASLLLGYAAVKMSMKKNYIPLERLLNVFSAKSNDAIGTDELVYLEHRVLELKELYKEAHRSVADNKHIARVAEFQKLLLPPGVKVQESNSEAEELFAKFKNGINMVLMFCIRDGLEQKQEENAGAPEMEHSLKQFVVANVLAEGIGEMYTQETVEYGDRVVMVVNLPKGETDFTGELRKLCDKYCGFVEDNFKFRINTFAGSGYKGIKGIHYSYLEACQAESFGADSNENYICYPEVSSSATLSYQYSFETEEMVINAVREKNNELATTLINKMLKDSWNEPDRMLWQCMLYDVYTTLLKVSEEMHNGTKRIASINEAFTITSLKELQDWFDKVIAEICGCDLEQFGPERSKGREKEELYQSILNYIRDNFKNPDLNVSQIAMAFNITPVYMSAIFKRRAGKSILDVIRQARIEHARTLLEEGMNVGEVASEVGFSDSTAFGRTFKNYYGVTPGKVKKRS